MFLIVGAVVASIVYSRSFREENNRLHEHMTMEEALTYIRTSNTQENRYAHFVNMDDFAAQSSYIINDSELQVLGKYRIGMMQQTVIRVGTRVELENTIDCTGSRDGMFGCRLRKGGNEGERRFYTAT